MLNDVSHDKGISYRDKILRLFIYYYPYPYFKINGHLLV